MASPPSVVAGAVHDTLRTFLDDCLSDAVGPQRALDRIGDDSIALQQLARYSLECEERVATGCLMVQALTLVRYWTLQSKQPSTPANEGRIVEWGQWTGGTHAHSFTAVLNG